MSVSLASVPRKPKAPCGHDWRASCIERTFRILFPTVFVSCRCQEHKATWAERYEFDFSVPMGGLTDQQAAADEN